ncbi:MAG: hypothetical protein WD181_00630, partial [Solirubrobacterales bacterium]
MLRITRFSSFNTSALGLLALLCLFLLILVAPSDSSAASKSPGGCTDSSSGGLILNTGKCKPATKARLVNGKAIAPASAPDRVKAVIEWANRIRNKPYRYGGGHASFFDTAYDCSGTVSFALRGGRFVSSPMPSTGYFSWGEPGRGKWITTYSNSGHMYMVVAGLRFDTSMTPG